MNRGVSSQIEPDSGTQSAARLSTLETNSCDKAQTATARHDASMTIGAHYSSGRRIRRRPPAGQCPAKQRCPEQFQRPRESAGCATPAKAPVHLPAKFHESLTVPHPPQVAFRAKRWLAQNTQAECYSTTEAADQIQSKEAQTPRIHAMQAPQPSPNRAHPPSRPP